MTAPWKRCEMCGCLRPVESVRSLELTWGEPPKAVTSTTWLCADKAWCVRVARGEA